MIYGREQRDTEAGQRRGDEKERNISSIVWYGGRMKSSEDTWNGISTEIR